MEVALPSEVLAEVEDLVRFGEFPDAATGIVALVREGLSYRYRRTSTPPMPVDRDPQGPRGPGLPGDVNWIP